jgi:hypothetical protein
VRLLCHYPGILTPTIEIVTGQDTIFVDITCMVIDQHLSCPPAPFFTAGFEKIVGGFGETEHMCGRTLLQGKCVFNFAKYEPVCLYF